MNNKTITEFRSSLRKIERYLFSSIKEDGICCGITFNECHILMEILDNGEMPMSILIRNIGLDKSIISRSVETMVKNRLLQRTESADDRRMKILKLTEEGQRKALSINNYMNKKYTLLLEEIPAAEQENIIASGNLLADIFGRWIETEKKNKTGYKNGCCM